ncbi:MAG: hypothetical protein ABWY06_12280 [Pseudomonas sp.]|uniref:hypothetical protein n=1 Tax=Pseudomonas sp. TaxID=306 RepID=UPI003399EC34
MNALQKARQSIHQLAEAMARTDQARAEFARLFSAAASSTPPSRGAQPLPRGQQAYPAQNARDAGRVLARPCACNATRTLERVSGRR